MNRMILAGVCAVAFALVGCNQNVYLEQETPPGQVPPVTSTPDPETAPDA